MHWRSQAASDVKSPSRNKRYLPIDSTHFGTIDTSALPDDEVQALQDIDITEYRSKEELEPQLLSGYYAPRIHNQPSSSFHAFIYDNSSERSLAIVFQATISKHHPVSEKGLLCTWLQCMGVLGVQDIIFVAVTPVQPVGLIMSDAVSNMVREWYQLQIKAEDFDRMAD